MPRTHHLPDEEVHLTWDVAHEPVLGIDSGDTVVVWTRDVSDNQIGPSSDASVLGGLDMSRLYPLCGPIAIKGAEPGDTLAIEILDIHTQGWGRTALLPGLGLLTDESPDPYLRIFEFALDLRCGRDHEQHDDDVHGHEEDTCPQAAQAQAPQAAGRAGLSGYRDDDNGDLHAHDVAGGAGFHGRACAAARAGHHTFGGHDAFGGRHAIGDAAHHADDPDHDDAHNLERVRGLLGPIGCARRRHRVQQGGIA